MPKKITSLTPEQEARIPEWINKWVAIGLKTGKTDWETFDAYMPVCYEQAGLKYPTRVVRVSSPLVGTLASAIASQIWNKIYKDNRDSVHASVQDSVHASVQDSVHASVQDSVQDSVKASVKASVNASVNDSVNASVKDSVNASVYASVYASVNDSVNASVNDSVHDSVHDSVGTSVYASVYTSVNDSVKASVYASVKDSVNASVYDSVNDSVKEQILIKEAIIIAKKYEITPSWNYWLGGQFWVGGWYSSPSFVSFFTDVCGLELNKDIMERATAYRRVCESVNYIWCNRDYVMVCARPTKIEQDEQGRLHSTKGQAIEYMDGWGLTMLHGHKFDSVEEMQKHLKMSVKETLAIDNVDRRAVLMMEKPPEAIFEELECKKIDEASVEREGGTTLIYELYAVDGLTNETEKMLRYKCASFERTGKMYTKFIEPHYTSALQAIAESHNLTGEEYLSVTFQG